MSTTLNSRPWQAWPNRHLALAGLLGCFLAGVVFLASRPHPAPSPEALRDQLVMRDGHWYRPGQTQPFTGILLERYETGALKSRSEISHGLPDGLSEGWHTNGQKQVSERFHAGVSHGVRAKWHDNGRKLSEIMIVEGKLHGTFRRWNADGTLSEEVEMRRGNPDGLSRAYYRSGFVKAEAHLRDGAVLEQKFWKEGERRGPTNLAQ